jgi:transcriptional regulator with XRE-family HTH domain
MKNKPNQIPFGANLERLRKARNLTQQALADASGVTRVYINMLETGQKTEPTLSRLRKLALALDVPVAVLVV